MEKNKIFKIHECQFQVYMYYLQFKHKKAADPYDISYQNLDWSPLKSSSITLM